MRLVLSAALCAALFTMSPAMAQDHTAAGAATAGPAAEAAGGDDPFVWMEKADDAKALDWVKTENARTLGVLQADPRYQGFHDAALKIATATDRIPAPGFHGLTDQIDNFWQDKDHMRGLWRRTTLASYETATPEWKTVLDVDQLSKEAGANWVYKGGDCLAPEERLCLVSLSTAGKDAVEVREFDSESGTFIDGGFHLPDGKQNVSWIDKDTLLVSREWTPGEMTASGYAFVIKALKRGQPLDQAHEVFRGTKTDVSVDPFVLRDPDGKIQAVMVRRGVSFFESEYYLLGDASGLHAAQKLPLPLKSSIVGTLHGQLIMTLEQDWAERDLKQGDLIAFDLAALKRDPASAKATLILRPGPRQSIDGITMTRNRMVLAFYDNVKGNADVYDVKNGLWSHTRLDLPRNVSVGLGSASSRDDHLFLSVSGYLTPSSLYLADAATGAVKLVKTSPARFDATGLTVDQFEATSSDGTKVPYFVVHRANWKLDGSNPTLLYAYGGFQVSMLPGYSGNVGKLWLERGGVYVVANIRGGGEFGPAWHNAGLKQHRQLVYDDFAAVGKDLIARNITSPRRLGIEGGSNGGLLMGVEMTQHPDLWNAVVIQVPLFDMIRYTQIDAGASWVGEYGDPAIPEQRAYIEKYSPYQAIKASVKYPEPYFETSTADDRVGPGHARKAAAKMQALGYPFYYYENIEGGHAAAANLAETAKRVALEFTYLTRKLMD
ncbi:MAG TPA: prolyl oligopeptidase family serine peptidase [Caulobacteraceae bacterium]|jgi:prolyl oligopeptidase